MARAVTTADSVEVEAEVMVVEGEAAAMAVAVALVAGLEVRRAVARQVVHQVAMVGWVEVASLAQARFGRASRAMPPAGTPWGRVGAVERLSVRSSPAPKKSVRCEYQCVCVGYAERGSHHTHFSTPCLRHFHTIVRLAAGRYRTAHSNMSYRTRTYPST